MKKPYFWGGGLNQNSWLRSGHYNGATHSRCLNTSDGYGNSYTTNTYAVRPALHSLTKEVCKIFPVFYSVMRNRTDLSYEMKGTAVPTEPNIFRRGQNLLNLNLTEPRGRSHLSYELVLSG